MRVSGPARTTRELAQISKSLGRIARDEFVMLVHDLRNPLATVNMCTQLLLRDAHSDNLHEGLRNIHEAALRLEGLLDELSALREPHRAFGAMTSPDPSDAVELVRRIARGAKRVRVSSQESEIVGYWNVVELERLVANLIDNALKYSPPGQPVEVTVGTADGCVVITVSDQGIGIPSTDVPRVFDRGYRATNAKATFPGDGLGLVTVRRIVDALHGTITLASEEGVGTSVTVRLPTAKDAENSRRALGAKGCSHEETRLILTDDHVVLRQGCALLEGQPGSGGSWGSGDGRNANWSASCARHGSDGPIMPALDGITITQRLRRVRESAC
jgi:signal transduction histidine kinase